MRALPRTGFFEGLSINFHAGVRDQRCKHTNSQSKARNTVFFTTWAARLCAQRGFSRRSGIASVSLDQ
jgi:hypothetical protein